jgi:hypothetical protein
MRLVVILATLWASLVGVRQFAFDSRSPSGTGVIFIDHTPRIDDQTESLLLVFEGGQLVGMDTSTQTVWVGEDFPRLGPWYPMEDPS